MSGQHNGHATIVETTLDLCYLMRDLEILASELSVAEEADGRPFGTHQAPLSDRLGVVSE